MVFVHAKEVIVDDELRVEVVGAASFLGEVSAGHRVDELLLVVVEDRRGALQHLIVAVGVLTGDRVLLVDGHVRHLLHGDIEQVVVVHVVLGVGHREVGRDLDALTDIVVKCHTSGETVEFLHDHGTGLMVVTQADTEGGLLTTTGHGDVVVLTQTVLCDGVAPVGVVVVLLVFGERRIVVDLTDVLTACIALCGVEVALLKHHGVVVTIEQCVALWLVGSGELE